MPKPMLQDIAEMSAGQVLFGWAHCVQQHEITQMAIDRRITIIAWEAMHLWSSNGEKTLHIFYKNNEIAGYAAVLHCLQLVGQDGFYGPRRRVVVLSYGSVSRGAIYALRGRGFNNIYTFTRRPPHLVADQNPDVYYGQYFVGPNGRLMARDSEGNEMPLIDELKTADIICNGILQDTDNPLMFIDDNDVSHLKSRSLIIDISCDEGMGFVFAKPTSFKSPIIQLDRGILYYSVDHTPSYLWNAASREISKALIPYLEQIFAGPVAWDKDETIRAAIQVNNGVICDPKILSFQKRELTYPHKYID